jgi:transposase-like protein
MPFIKFRCVAAYLRHPLSYRNLAEMMLERGLTPLSDNGVSLGPDLRSRTGQAMPTLGPTNDTRAVDQTYIEVKAELKYLYRAVDSLGFTLELMLSTRRDARAAERFCRQALKSTHNQSPNASASSRRRQTSCKD